jgi:hypothetical protein
MNMIRANAITNGGEKVMMTYVEQVAVVMKT